MFTGLIEEIGTVRTIQHQGGSRLITIRAPLICAEIDLGDSIAVNGVCLTVTAFQTTEFSAQAVEETVGRTTLKHLSTGSLVNLERALRLSDRLGGHLVAGHVDDTGSVRKIDPQPSSWLICIDLPMRLHKYVIDQGSIAVNGISLTIVQTQPELKVSIIPETWQRTTLSQLRPGDQINIEVDLIGKYIEKFVYYNQKSSLSLERLSELGYS